MSNRMQRADAEIQRAISEILLKEMADPRLSSVVTVTSVKTTPDFKWCKIKVSVLSNEKAEREEVISLIRKSASFIRTRLVNLVRMPSAPKLVFDLDEGASHSERINQILEGLVIPPAEEE